MEVLYGSEETPPTPPPAPTSTWTVSKIFGLIAIILLLGAAAYMSFVAIDEQAREASLQRR